MPGFEQTLILKCSSRTQLADGLRKNLGYLLQNGAVIQRVDNLGQRRLPQLMHAFDRELVHTGHYFLVHFRSPSGMRDRIRPLQRLDPYVIRGHLCNDTDNDWVRPCSTGQQCRFGEKEEPNYEQKYGIRRGYRHY